MYRMFYIFLFIFVKLLANIYGVLCIQYESKKVAMIRNRYNQVPHLTQDTKWESNNHTF